MLKEPAAAKLELSNLGHELLLLPGDFLEQVLHAQHAHHLYKRFGGWVANVSLTYRVLKNARYVCRELNMRREMDGIYISLIFSSFWTSRGSQVPPLLAPGTCLHFYSAGRSAFHHAPIFIGLCELALFASQCLHINVANIERVGRWATCESLTYKLPQED